MISEDHVGAVVGYMAECRLDSEILIDYVKFLKNLIETDVGVSKDRQKQVVHQLNVKMSKVKEGEISRL